ncbi:carbon starvation protein A [bacterium]|nr:carbon starvation protein A [bacterium]
MSASWLMAIAIVVFIIGYRFYGKFLTRRFDVDPQKQTPAHKMSDGIDYVPAKTPVLLGHHFSSIAGAGPILGPIMAAVFGWVPVFLWILLGSLFIGGVHDFSSVMASIRHGGKSIGEVIEGHIGHGVKQLFLFFAWFTLVVVIAVFCKIVATTFEQTPSAAMSSFLFIILAILFGLSIYRWRVPLGIGTLVGVLFLLACVLLGLRFPIYLTENTWMVLLFGYVFIAAVTPVWILLQPRDFLNSFLLYFILIGGVVGIFVTHPTIQLPAFTRINTDLGLIFPILFVTVACGAISGFHSLVASGTTSKQLNKETDALLIGYGSMLIEGILAIVALVCAVTVAGIAQENYSQWVNSEGPINIFSRGVGSLIASLGIPEKTGITFAALSISAFCLTTLDTATRLGRFLFQEIFHSDKKSNVLSSNRSVGTLATIGLAALLAFSGTSTTLWPLFGSANQLLAAIALLTITVWLAEIRKKNRFVKYPMIFMFGVTLTALGSLIYTNVAEKNITLLIFAVLLFGLAFVLVIQAAKRLKKLEMRVS